MYSKFSVLLDSNRPTGYDGHSAHIWFVSIRVCIHSTC